MKRQRILLIFEKATYFTYWIGNPYKYIIRIQNDINFKRGLHSSNIRKELDLTGNRDSIITFELLDLMCLGLFHITASKLYFLFRLVKWLRCEASEEPKIENAFVHQSVSSFATKHSIRTVW